jgi:O-succinylbenzoic acid--CoA ligase
VEAAIQATQLVSDVCVTGIPDRHWGQAVTAVYVPQSETVSFTVLQAVLKDKLSKYKQPKYWIPVARLPRNAQGKVDYEKLQAIVMSCLETPNSSLQRSG